MAEEVIRHETGSNVVMNCATRSNGHRSYLVAGQESHCQLYHVNLSVVQEDADGVETLRPTHHQQRKGSIIGDDASVRYRKGSNSTRGSVANGVTNKTQSNDTRIKFDIRAGDLTQTDFTANGPLQRVVRLSRNCKLMATGGTDAVVRIWSFPKMIKQFDLEIHTKEVDDLDFSPNSKLIVSIAKDSLAVVWNLETRKELTQLKWSPPDNVKYLFKRCRFGVCESKKDQHRLYTIANPLGKVGQQVKKNKIYTCN